VAQRRVVSRRRFLALSAGGIGVVAGSASAPTKWLFRGMTRQLADLTPADFTHTLTRAADQLHVRFEFVHMVRNGNQLESTGGGDPLIRIVLGSQHTAEELSPGGTPSGDAIGHRSAGESRIVLEPETLPIDFTTDALLDLADFALAVDPRTQDGAGGGPGAGAPSEDVTALELPEGLLISPDASSRFIAATDPLTRDDVSEVWRARLGTQTIDGPQEPPIGSPVVRALAETSGADPFNRALEKDIRDALVTATTDYSNPSYPENEPLSVQKLWLTPTGGYLEVTGSWEEGSPAGLLISLLERAATGRDLQVRVAQRGFLAPLGFPATILSVSERQFLIDDDGDKTAVLVEEEYLTLTSSTVAYDHSLFPNGGRLWPFTSAVVTNTVDNRPVSKQTIELDGNVTVPDTQAWIVIDDTTGDPLEIDCVLTDHLGNEVDIKPLGVLFASNEHAQTISNTGPVNEIVDFYADEDNLEPFRTAGTDGGAVAFAGTTDDERRLTEVECTEITLGVTKPAGGVTVNDLEAAGAPSFLPKLTSFKIRPEELSTSGEIPPATSASYSNAWRDDGFGSNNEGLTYAEIEEPFDVSFESDGKGLAKPSITVDTLSLALGAGFDPPAPNSSWNPADVVPSGASLLGVIELRDLLQIVNVGSDVATTKGLPHVETILEPLSGIPDRARLIFDWAAPLKTSGVFVAAADLVAEELEPLIQPPTELNMHVEQVVPFDGSDPSTTVDIGVTAFALRVPIDPVVVVYFKDVQVHAPADGPVSFDPQVVAVRFHGTLGFLDPLQDFLEDLLGFTIDVDPEAIVGSLGITLPDLSFGIVNVRNARVNLNLELPISNAVPTVNLELGTRSSPVSVTVLGIGGSASFGVGVAARNNPFEFLELWMGVVLEAEANFVIGKAGVRLEVGAGLVIQGGGTVVILTGYVSLKGAVEILGFAVLSVGVEASLTYQVNNKLLSGRLRIVLAAIFGQEISASVEASVKMGGSGGGGGLARTAALGVGGDTASFGDRHSRNSWKTYCNTFA
jgi:hypothetical protein